MNDTDLVVLFSSGTCKPNFSCDMTRLQRGENCRLCLLSFPPNVFSDWILSEFCICLKTLHLCSVCVTRPTTALNWIHHQMFNFLNKTLMCILSFKFRAWQFYQHFKEILHLLNMWCLTLILGTVMTCRQLWCKHADLFCLQCYCFVFPPIGLSHHPNWQ